MESKDGVDVSWLHHSKDPHAVKDASTPTKDRFKLKDEKKEKPSGRRGSKAGSNGEMDGTMEPKHNGDVTPQAHLPLPRSQLHRKQSEEAVSSPVETHSPATKDSKQRPADSKRRGSWISNISSKFSSSGQQQTPTSSPSPATISTPDVKEITTSGAGANGSPLPKEIKKVDSSPPVAVSPKGGPSFLQSALRRLSSSSGAGGGKIQGTGGICPRMVLNVDPYRERCQIDDLQPAKLRRVSFCVDVEIAAPPPRYDDEEDSPPPPPASGRRPSLTQLEKISETKKARDKNVKIKEKAEGEALKNPDAIAETKEKVGDVEKTEQKIEPTANPATVQEPSGDEANCEGKKKKKRTEAEKAERKDRKRQQALANGTIPMEISLNSSSEEASAPGTPDLKSQDRPTTDPLRIYRRCCQLRESPVLKRVADQLSAPTACDPDRSGVVTCIDLTGFKIPLSDTITLGDWLAIVPVRKLMLEDCDLTDEAVRVVLAGLLAAKTPDQSRFNRHLAKGNGEKGAKAERLGVIEKLSLKDNPRLTRDGWRHVSYFLNMSKSLKAIDLSGIKMPAKGEDTQRPPQHHLLGKPHPDPKTLFNVAEVFEKALSERIAGDRLEELVMAKCELNTDMVESVVRGVTASGVRRLGLAYNELDLRGIEAVCNFLLTGRCEGLDLGGNNLSEHTGRLVAALENHVHEQPLFALSVADCNLNPQTLKSLLPVLAKLNQFKFIDLSHNHQLFETQPDAIPLLRKYLPKLLALRRIHLNDVALDPEQCIALAEVLPEVPNLAHVGILDNPKLTALASAQEDEALQEEACAYYASIMAAVRVSRSIVSIDIDMPSPDATELVRALGKQILAYALRNLERGPAAEALADVPDEGRQDSLVEVPDILLHLVGRVDGFPEDHDDDAPAPSEDYIVSGTGVVKALGICLGNKASDRRSSRMFATPRSGSNPPSHKDSGTTTPLQPATQQEVDQFKAKEMSKNLLDSARKIRHRLQPALAKESKSDDETTYRRLKFLDSTLARMIERFEEEYPECRPARPASATSDAFSDAASDASPPATQQIFSNPFSPDGRSIPAHPFGASATAIDDEDDDAAAGAPHLSRHGSDASLAARHQAHEEGQMHRFGQQMRRSILAPQSFDYHHQATAEGEAEHLTLLRTRLEGMTGQEIKEKVYQRGIEGVIQDLDTSAEELRRFEEMDPEGFEKLREAQQNATWSAASAQRPVGPVAE